MKTTIELPDAILRRAKVIAAERDTTLKELVTQALEMFLESSSKSDQKSGKKAMRALLRRMQASNDESMQPLTREQIHDR